MMPYLKALVKQKCLNTDSVRYFGKRAHLMGHDVQRGPYTTATFMFYILQAMYGICYVCKHKGGSWNVALVSFK